MEQSSSFHVRVMSRNELDLALDWAAEEGWNPGLADGDCFRATDPAGFLIGYLDREPVASISVVRYASNFGFCGFYIVRLERRGQGFGLQLWQAGIARLGQCTIGLDGVIAQQANYRGSGFVLAHRNVRYGGSIGCARPHDPRLAPVRAQHLHALISYDRGFFPAGREAFLRCWLTPDQRHALALVENGNITGYGVIRACRTGFKIGPLFADSDSGADVLFRALAATAKDELVFIDCPEPNRSGVALATRYGLSPLFETARMYRGPAPQLPLPHIYGITTFELG